MMPQRRGPTVSHPEVSAVLIVRNESANIDACLSCLTWASEIIVADTGSTDDTRERAARHAKVKLIDVEFAGYGAAKAQAVEAARNDWILSIDADERISPELATELRVAIATDPRGVAFSIARRNHFLDKPVQTCGWWPDRVVRLFRKSEGQFGMQVVHEGVQLAEGVGVRELSYSLTHFTVSGVAQFFQKQLKYGLLGAEELRRNNRAPSTVAVFLRPGFAFFRVYVLRGGFRDGSAGFLIAAGAAYSTLVKYAVHAFGR